MNHLLNDTPAPSCSDLGPAARDSMPRDLHADRAGARCTPSDCRAILAAAHAAHPLAADPALLERRARAFRALADPTRLRIMALLLVRELCLCEIVDALQAAESTLVHHLRMLEAGEMVTARREGKFTYFRAIPGTLRQYRPLDPDLPAATPLLVDGAP